MPAAVFVGRSANYDAECNVGYKIEEDNCDLEERDAEEIDGVVLLDRRVAEKAFRYPVMPIMCE